MLPCSFGEPAMYLLKLLSLGVRAQGLAQTGSKSRSWYSWLGNGFSSTVSRCSLQVSAPSTLHWGQSLSFLWDTIHVNNLLPKSASWSWVVSEGISEKRKHITATKISFPALTVAYLTSHLGPTLGPQQIESVDFYLRLCIYKMAKFSFLPLNTSPFWQLSYPYFTVFHFTV